MSESLEPAELAERVASLLFGSPSDGDGLRLARGMIDAGEGKRVFEALLEHTKTVASADDLATRLLSLLEGMVDADAYVAAYLMARLYPLAGKIHDHEVCNSIELWMHNLSSIDIATTLDQLATEGVRPSLRSRFQEWATAIRGKASG